MRTEQQIRDVLAHFRHEEHKVMLAGGPNTKDLDSDEYNGWINALEWVVNGHTSAGAQHNPRYPADA